MSIQQNVENTRTNNKDWRCDYYEIEQQRRELLARLEEAQRLEENPKMLLQKINEDITRRLKESW